MRGTRVYGIIAEIFMRGELTVMLESRLYMSNGISLQPSDPVLITGSACSDEERIRFTLSLTYRSLVLLAVPKCVGLRSQYDLSMYKSC